MAQLTTTDATITVLDLIPLATDELVLADFVVTGNDDNQESLVGRYLYAAKRESGSAVEVSSDVLVEAVEAALTGAVVTIDVTGNDIRVRVTGLAATNIYWNLQVLSQTRHPLEFAPP